MPHAAAHFVVRSGGELRLDMPFMGDFPRVTVIGTEHACGLLNSLINGARALRLRAADLRGSLTTYRVVISGVLLPAVTFVAVFNTRSNIGVKFFTNKPGQ